MKTNKHIMVTIPFEEKSRRRLESAAPGCLFTYSYDKDKLKDTNVILGNVSPGRLAELNTLEWVQLSSAGTEPYSKPGVLPRGTILTNATGAFGLAISEHMVAAVMALYKKLHLYRDNQLKSAWLDRGEVKSIEGAVVLTVGLGDIGGNFARRMKALGAYTIGIRRSDSRKPDYIDELYLSDALDDLLPRADIVALSLPGTDATTGLISRERIAKMKDGATIVNVGRGYAIDTQALCDALDSGKLYGAALDVTDPEPLPETHRLWKCENALITPHISGYYHLRATYDNIIDICIDNMSRYIKGEELKNIVDFNTGYRRL